MEKAIAIIKKELAFNEQMAKWSTEELAKAKTKTAKNDYEKSQNRYISKILVLQDVLGKLEKA